MVLLVAPSPSSCSSSTSKNSSLRWDAISSSTVLPVSDSVPCKLMTDRTVPSPPSTPIPAGGVVGAVAPSSPPTNKFSFSSSLFVDQTTAAGGEGEGEGGAVAIVPASDNNTNFLISCRQQQHEQQPATQLEQSHSDELGGAEMDSEDDDCSSDSSSVYSDGSSSYDTGSVFSLMNESDSLNERRRAMLDLSISKIQTINASNVSVSLRKSLLIYKTMKSLQRELDACGVYMCDSLMERGGNGVAASAAANDVEMLEEEEDEAEVDGDWELQRVSDLDNNPISNGIDLYNSLCNQRLGYGWTWADTSEYLITPSSDTIQNSEKCTNVEDMVPMLGRGGMYCSSGNNNNSNIWSGTNTATNNSSGGYIDDYLGMWGAWEDENYNPLTNCNLTQAEIMNMFRLPAVTYHHHHLNGHHQLVSQA